MYTVDSMDGWMDGYAEYNIYIYTFAVDCGAADFDLGTSLLGLN
jgi:hypothetical protein